MANNRQLRFKEAEDVTNLISIVRIGVPAVLDHPNPVVKQKNIPAEGTQRSGHFHTERRNLSASSLQRGLLKEKSARRTKIQNVLLA